MIPEKPQPVPERTAAYAVLPIEGIIVSCLWNDRFLPGERLCHAEGIVVPSRCNFCGTAVSRNKPLLGGVAHEVLNNDIYVILYITLLS